MKNTKLTKVAYELNGFTSTQKENSILLKMSDKVEVSVNNADIEKMTVDEIIKMMKSHYCAIQRVAKIEREEELAEKRRLKRLEAREMKGGHAHVF